MREALLDVQSDSEDESNTDYTLDFDTPLERLREKLGSNMQFLLSQGQAFTVKASACPKLGGGTGRYTGAMVYISDGPAAEVQGVSR